MTWPNTAISTTYLDAGSDRPSQARADIKLMADAVNAMITEGGGSKFIKIQIVSGTGNFQNLGLDPGSGSYIYRVKFAITADPAGIATLSDSNYRITLPAGTYHSTMPLTKVTISGGNFDTFLNAITAANTAATLSFSTTTAIGVNQGFLIFGTGGQNEDWFTIATATTFEMRVAGANNISPLNTYATQVNLIKF
jgi:hypothetical protein